MKSILLTLISVTLTLCPRVTVGQNLIPSSPAPPILHGRLLNEVDQRLSRVTQFMDRKTKQYLKKIQRQEAKIKRKLSSKDSALTAQLFSFTDQLQDQQAALSYNGHLDSLRTALNFLGNTSQSVPATLNKTIDRINNSQTSLNLNEAKGKLLQERITLLKEKLSGAGLGKELKAIDKQVTYYKQQVADYKKLLSNPKQIEAKLMEAITESKPFKKFFNQYSALATLFRLPSEPEMAIITGTGMQTRQALNTEVLQRMGVGADPNQFVNTETSKAQLKINELKGKIQNLSDKGDGAENSAPGANPHKTKSLANRLEYGTNIQSMPSNQFFPVVTDVAFQIAYRLDRKWQAGIGGAAKIGWGKDWSNVAISGQGLGIRSFCDYKLFGNISGFAGLEYNFTKPFSSYQHLKNIDHWSQSGLVGLSRKIPISRNGNKNSQVSLLWDFLSYQQTPRTAAIKLRFGYTISK